MDFLDYYNTESINEELGTNGFANFVDRIGRHPEGSANSKGASNIGVPKNIWNVNPIESKSYRGNYENYTRFNTKSNENKKIATGYHKKMKKAITLLQKQLADVQSQMQSGQQPISQDVQKQTSLKLKSALEHQANFEKDYKEYNDVIEGFKTYIQQMHNALKDPEKLDLSRISQLETGLKLQGNGLMGINEYASAVYNYLDSESGKKFSDTHKIVQEAMTDEYKVLSQVIIKLKEDITQKKLEAEKEKQDAEINSQSSEKGGFGDTGDGFVADEPEHVVTNTDRINNIIKKDNTIPDVMQDLIKQVRELNPELGDLSDEQLLELIKDQNNKERTGANESVSFSDFYFTEAPREWDSSRGGTLKRMAKGAIDNQVNSPYLLNRLFGRGVKKLITKSSGMNFRKQKHLVTKTVNTFPVGLAKDKFFAIDYQLYTATNAACGNSLTEYRTHAKENGKSEADKIAKGFIMVYERDALVMEEDILANISEWYNFPNPAPKTLNLMEGTIWKTSNHGIIVTLQTIKDENPENNDRTTISQDEKENIMYFVGCDAKGLEFFADNFNMSFRQYLQNTRNAPEKMLGVMNQNINNATGEGGSNQSQKPVYYVKTVRDRNKAEKLKEQLNEFLVRSNSSIQKRININSNKDGVGEEIVFRDGQSLKYVTNSQKNFVILVNDPFFKNSVKSIDPEWSTGYVRM